MTVHRCHHLSQPTPSCLVALQVGEATPSSHVQVAGAGAEVYSRIRLALRESPHQDGRHSSPRGAARVRAVSKMLC